MKAILEAVFIAQLFIGVSDGLSYAGYKISSRNAEISSLDRYRCGEMHLGFEYIGYMVSSNGSCEGIPYGWNDIVPTDSEMNKKSWTCNVFDVPLVLYKESNQPNVNEYIYYTQIPGDVKIGSRIVVIFEPQDPWEELVFDFKGANGENSIFSVTIKSTGENGFDSCTPGNCAVELSTSGFGFKSGEDTTLSLVFSAGNNIELSVNGTTKTKNGVQMPAFSYKGATDPIRITEMYTKDKSHCLLKSVCFHGL